MKQNYEVIEKPEDVKYLDAMLLDKNGRILLHPSEFYRAIPRIHLRTWCYNQARYSLPTIEMVEWIKSRINGRSAIEIGTGNGDLGFHLGIRETDSYCQQKLEVLLYYAMHAQKPTNPRQEVEKIDAIDAIKKYKPDVVVGSWITQKNRGNDPSGNMYGPEEEIIISLAKTYIHVGNTQPHDSKRILAISHETIQPPWIISRARRPEDDIIWVWDW